MWLNYFAFTVDIICTFAEVSLLSKPISFGADANSEFLICFLHEHVQISLKVVRRVTVDSGDCIDNCYC